MAVFPSFHREKTWKTPKVPRLDLLIIFLSTHHRVADHRGQAVLQHPPPTIPDLRPRFPHSQDACALVWRDGKKNHGLCWFTFQTCKETWITPILLHINSMISCSPGVSKTLGPTKSIEHRFCRAIFTRKMPYMAAEHQEIGDTHAIRTASFYETWY